MDIKPKSSDIEWTSPEFEDICSNPGPSNHHPNKNFRKRRSNFKNEGKWPVDDRYREKLAQIAGPCYELPPLDMTEKKFSSRSRLYIGNIAPEVTKQDLEELFVKFGEISELFVNREKHFAFVKLDFQCNADRARRDLDGINLKGKNLKIRVGSTGATVKVKNLTPFVTNELLHLAFGIFGEIERCVISVDDRGKPTGEGVVEFSRKSSAALALQKCREKCYFLSFSLRPVICEPFEVFNDPEGFPEKLIHKKNSEYMKERQIGPRFAQKGSFEEEYGTRWKHIFELHAQKELALKKELEFEINKLEAQMEYARYEQETEVLREILRNREAQKDRQKREWEMRERQAEEMRLETEGLMRQQEKMMREVINGNKEMEERRRRRQEESKMYMQAHELNGLLEEQEKAYGQREFVIVGEEGGGDFDRNSGVGFDTRGGDDDGGVARSNNCWVEDRGKAKRRRY